MATLILKNIGLTALSINDLGIYLEPDQSIDLIASLRDEDIIESVDLETAMSGDITVKLDDITLLDYAQVIEYLTKLSKYDTIDYAYISSKDSDTDITGLELESLTDGSDASFGTELHNHATIYYTKTELQTSGQATVDWGNINNAPAYGAVSWKEPVDRTDASYGSGIMLPVSNNEINDARMVRDDGDGHPAQYVCIATSGAWNLQWVKIADIDWGDAGSISVTPLGNLTSINVQDALEELQGDIDGMSIPSLDDAYNVGSTITVDDTDLIAILSDTKNFKIQSDSGSTDILSIAATSTGDSITINSKLDVNGGTITLDATGTSNFSVTGANLTISTITSGNIIFSSVGTLTLKDQYLTAGIAISQSGVSGLTGFTATSIVGALNELKSNFGNMNSLDEAYDGGGSGVGRTIIVDSGPVKLDATSGTYAPLELTQQSVTPSSGLAAGQLTYIGGELYAYNGTKWLSVSGYPFVFADDNVDGKYANIGEVNHTQVGFRIPVNATIVDVSVMAQSGASDKAIEIRKNGSPTSLKSFSLSSYVYTSTNDSIDLTAGDFLQLYVSAVGNPAQNMVAIIFIKWRK